MSDLQTNRPDDKFFISDENTSFVVNERTGRAFISQRAASRLLECPEKTLRYNISASNIGVEKLEIPTQGGLQAASLLSANDFAKLASKFKPSLLLEFIDFGANMYLCHQAGYKLNLEPPKFEYIIPSDEELVLEALEGRISKIKFDQRISDKPGLRNLVEHFQNPESPEIPQDETFYSIAQWAKIEGVSLTKPDYNKLIKRAASNFRDAYGGETNPKLKLQPNGKFVYHYQQKDFCFIENAYNSTMTQKEITNLRRGKNLERKRESLDRLIDSMKSPFDENEI